MDFIDLKAQYRKFEPAINERIHRVLEHGRFIMGPEVEELETVLADFVGCRHAITVASGITGQVIYVDAGYCITGM